MQFVRPHFNYNQRISFFSAPPEGFFRTTSLAGGFRSYKKKKRGCAPLFDVISINMGGGCFSCVQNLLMLGAYLSGNSSPVPVLA